MNKNEKTQLNKRALTFFFMIFSAVILPISGIMLHGANDHNEESMKYYSMAFHNMAAIVFSVSTIIHIKYNWKPILSYMSDKKGALVKYPKEIAIVGITIGVLIAIVILHANSSHF